MQGIKDELKKAIVDGGMILFNQGLTWVSGEMSVYGMWKQV